VLKTNDFDLTGGLKKRSNLGGGKNTTGRNMHPVALYAADGLRRLKSFGNFGSAQNAGRRNRRIHE
jgi:hypothetical protein